MNNIRFHVVVVGAGYSGVMATNRLLSEHPDVAATVVNPRTVFVERTRLHQHAAATGSATHVLTDLLHPRAELCVGTVERIDDGAVLLGDGSVSTCDAVVYAVGSGPARVGVPGGERAYSVSDLEAASALHTAIEALPDGATVTVVGGGFTGIETVTELASAHRKHRYTLVGDPGPDLPDRTRRYLRRTLTGLGIEILAGVAVTEISDGIVRFDDDTESPSDLTVWAGGFSVPDLAHRSGLDVDDSGRLRVDATLRSTNRSNVIGVGDAVTIADRPYVRMSCQAAIPLGVHGAGTVWDVLQGRDPDPLSLGFTAQCISLGRSRAALQFTTSADTPRATAVRGRPGALAKEGILRGTIWFMQRQARGHAPYIPAGPATDAVVAR
ncbi:NADH dehydrogenase FAD-containing subunit [Rhodococcus sp. SMB37]|uniref:NAD(P)/FAD-dependent oxidoreductase n=1 Tax=Rhodococcus sp. SMB37 TaxID=2512213 RepID=UPI0010EE5681|nr:FAD-dependent oxidoreductase [Rhodococcus sp. SMB37]TCN54791.1 NADH dehydrogenase FAD-containing subunit [Rhodococcus sp. SMB37]